MIEAPRSKLKMSVGVQVVARKVAEHRHIDHCATGSRRELFPPSIKAGERITEDAPLIIELLEPDPRPALASASDAFWPRILRKAQDRIEDRAAGLLVSHLTPRPRL